MSYKFRKHLCISGGAMEAQEWIKASVLESKDKAVLSRFVKRFPDLSFYKETEESLNNLEASQKIKFPQWLRNLLTTVGFIAQDQLEFRVSGFDEDYRFGKDRLTGFWFLPWFVYGEEQERNWLELLSFYPIAHETDRHTSRLIVSLREEDQAVYDYYYMDMMDAELDAEPIEDCIQLAFTSYISLFDHVTEVKLEDGTIIIAREI
ncbi:hypothetical protein [Xanthocytophaga agilis]|uniref:Uncharacterized protein n=1 Tax=Xanthocytophaga agilis TaxID=3048010 RepID=A0AAE3R7R5_9BACT|nr:hypothetical protein [Xanthocytophaga agilis]MDJ1505304.1 hypothetical protein [Xanthocytophaga agilis]